MRLPQPHVQPAAGSSTGFTTRWHANAPQQQLIVPHFDRSRAAISAEAAPAVMPINANSASENGSIANRLQVRQLALSYFCQIATIKPEHI